MVEDSPDAVRWPRSCRIGLRQIREKRCECCAERSVCVGRALDCFGPEWIIGLLCPCLKVGDEQLGYLASDRMFCVFDLAPRSRELVLDTFATYLFLAQQLIDLLPELVVNALIGAKDGTLGKPAPCFMGLRQKASLQAGISFQDILRGSEDLASTTELIPPALDGWGMRLRRLEGGEPARLLLLIERAHMLVKLRPVTDDNDGIAIEVAVEFFLFPGRDGNQRARSEHLGRLQATDAVEERVLLGAVLTVGPARMALDVLGRHHQPTVGELSWPHLVRHHDQNAFGKKRRIVGGQFGARLLSDIKAVLHGNAPIEERRRRVPISCRLDLLGGERAQVGLVVGGSPDQHALRPGQGLALERRHMQAAIAGGYGNCAGTIDMSARHSAIELFGRQLLPLLALEPGLGLLSRLVGHLLAARIVLQRHGRHGRSPSLTKGMHPIRTVVLAGAANSFHALGQRGLDEAAAVMRSQGNRAFRPSQLEGMLLIGRAVRQQQ